MDEADVAAPLFERELPDGFEVGQALDVARRPADLGDHDVVLARVAELAHPPLDLVDHVGDDLHGLAEVRTRALLLDHPGVDPAGGDVVGLRHRHVEEALVVAEVEVGLGAVIGDEHFAVLVRVHRPRIDVDVRVELLNRDAQSARF